jgi:guanylate kinase
MTAAKVEQRMTHKRGRLFVISGPSGSGKSSLCSALLARNPNLRLSISCTTRTPRPGEEDGVHYQFFSREAFESQVDGEAFLEWANVHGNLYGTRKSDVEEALAAGEDILLEIDWQGANQVAAKITDACRIFILPPSIETLRERLTSRGQDSAEVVEKRVAAAESEIAHADEAQYRIVNDDFNRALEELDTVYLDNRS